VHLLKRRAKLKDQKHPVSRAQHHPRKDARDSVITINCIVPGVPLGLGLAIFVVFVEQSIIEGFQVSILCAVENNYKTVPIGGGGGVDRDDILVLAEEEALELVVAVLPNLGVAPICSVRLGQLLFAERVEHALLVLNHSLNDIIFVDEENVAESSFSGLAQV